MSEAGENIRLQKAVEQYREPMKHIMQFWMRLKNASDMMQKYGSTVIRFPVIRIMWIRLAWKETMVSSI